MEPEKIYTLAQVFFNYELNDTPEGTQYPINVEIK